MGVERGLCRQGVSGELCIPCSLRCSVRKALLSLTYFLLDAYLFYSTYPNALIAVGWLEEGASSLVSTVPWLLCEPPWALLACSFSFCFPKFSTSAESTVTSGSLVSKPSSPSCSYY